MNKNIEKFKKRVQQVLEGSIRFKLHHIGSCQNILRVTKSSQPTTVKNNNKTNEVHTKTYATVGLVLSALCQVNKLGTERKKKKTILYNSTQKMSSLPSQE